jgi:hypothetical protein
MTYGIGAGNNIGGGGMGPYGMMMQPVFSPYAQKM